jgi:hypothetical protein
LIENLKDLERLLKLLRKQGVTDFKMNGVELKLGDLPSEPGDIAELEEQAEPTMTDEQIMAWAIGQTQ